ncbi:hypothetical protein, partial [Halobellus sp. EA9]|uniref:hypothetical protein n=1 Tax=Halobellus sp. EA9 TaxID=3421647 RepID=UPI003EBCD4D4
MASYKILPLRDGGIDLEKIENRVENLSALESSEDLRSGTLPRSFQTFRGEMCYVEYAFEEETEVTTLEGDDETIKVADMYPIISVDHIGLEEVSALGGCATNRSRQRD